jgi:hypothetical protein
MMMRMRKVKERSLLSQSVMIESTGLGIFIQITGQFSAFVAVFLEKIKMGKSFHFIDWSILPIRDFALMPLFLLFRGAILYYFLQYKLKRGI